MENELGAEYGSYKRKERCGKLRCGILKERVHLGDPDVGGRIQLKLILKKMKNLNGPIGFSSWIGGWTLRMRWLTVVVHKQQRISCFRQGTINLSKRNFLNIVNSIEFTELPLTFKHRNFLLNFSTPCI